MRETAAAYSTDTTSLRQVLSLKRELSDGRAGTRTSSTALHRGAVRAHWDPVTDNHGTAWALPRMDVLACRVLQRREGTQVAGWGATAEASMGALLGRIKSGMIETHLAPGDVENRLESTGGCRRTGASARQT
jgi:hypothetical protein